MICSYSYYIRCTKKITLRSVATTSECTFRLLYDRDPFRIQFFSHSSFYIRSTLHEQHSLVIKAYKYFNINTFNRNTFSISFYCVTKRNAQRNRKFNER